MMDLRKEIKKILITYFGESFYDEEITDLMALFDSHTRSVIGEDESEIQDMDRSLYFVGRNDLRAEQRSKLSPRGKEKAK